MAALGRPWPSRHKDIHVQKYFRPFSCKKFGFAPHVHKKGPFFFFDSPQDVIMGSGDNGFSIFAIRYGTDGSAAAIIKPAFVQGGAQGGFLDMGLNGSGEETGIVVLRIIHRDHAAVGVIHTD